MSNLQFQARPNFHALDTFLGKRSAKTLAYSTTVARVYDLDTKEHGFQIRYHGNLIAEITLDTVWVSNAGWGTPTTRNRINKVLWCNDIVAHVGQKNFAQTFHVAGELITNNFYSASFRDSESGWKLV